MYKLVHIKCKYFLIKIFIFNKIEIKITKMKACKQLQPEI